MLGTTSFGQHPEWPASRGNTAGAEHVSALLFCLPQCGSALVWRRHHMSGVAGCKVLSEALQEMTGTAIFFFLISFHRLSTIR